MNFVYRVVQRIFRKDIRSFVDYDVICECIDFSLAERVCNALTSVNHFEDYRYYMEFSVELFVIDGSPF